MWKFLSWSLEVSLYIFFYYCLSILPLSYYYWYFYYWLQQSIFFCVCLYTAFFKFMNCCIHTIHNVGEFSSSFFVVKILIMSFFVCNTLCILIGFHFIFSLIFILFHFEKDPEYLTCLTAEVFIPLIWTSAAKIIFEMVSYFSEVFISNILFHLRYYTLLIFSDICNSVLQAFYF